MTTAAAAQKAPVVHLVQLGQIKASPSNPRKNFADVDELAADVKIHGILSPVLLRPAKEGYELVFGERRWRAAKKAGLEHVPAFVREISDQEALELQIVENAKRTDIHPVEEAEAYRELHEKHKLSVDEIAAKVGKSRAHIYGRIKLCELAEPVKKAALAGELPATHALLIARIPDVKLQAEALKELIEDGEAISYREAVERVHRSFMLRLEKAPFDTADEKLVAAAGSCAKCPKRTGNQRELFADVKSPDVCTDPTCYRGKVAAHAEVKLKAVEEKGGEVLRGPKAEKIFNEQYDGSHDLRHDSGFVPLQEGRTYAGDRGYIDVAAAVKKNPGIKTVVVAHPDTGKPVELVPIKALPKAKERSSTNYETLNRKRAEKEKKQAAFGQSVLAPLVQRAEKTLGKPELAALVKTLIYDRQYDGLSAAIERRAGKDLSYAQEQKAGEQLEARVAKMSEAELRGWLFELVVLDRHAFELLGKGEGGLAIAAEALGVDLVKAKEAFDAPTPAQAAVATIRKIVKKAKAKPAAKAKPKKKPGKKK